jgi:hypothetical protein
MIFYMGILSANAARVDDPDIEHLSILIQTVQLIRNAALLLFVFACNFYLGSITFYIIISL